MHACIRSRRYIAATHHTSNMAAITSEDRMPPHDCGVHRILWDFVGIVCHQWRSYRHRDRGLNPLQNWSYPLLTNLIPFSSCDCCDEKKQLWWLSRPKTDYTDHIVPLSLFVSRLWVYQWQRLLFTKFSSYALGRLQFPDPFKIYRVSLEIWRILEVKLFKISENLYQNYRN